MLVAIGIPKCLNLFRWLRRKQGCELIPDLSGPTAVHPKGGTATKARMGEDGCPLDTPELSLGLQTRPCISTPDSRMNTEKLLAFGRGLCTNADRKNDLLLPL